MRGRTTADRQIESNHAFDQVTFDGTPEASVILLDAGASPLRVVRPRAAANLTEAAVSVESIGRVIKAKRVFILSLLLSGGLCPLINLTLPPCGSDVSRRGGSLAPTGGSEYLVYQARNTAAQEQTAEHAKETMLAGTPGLDCSSPSSPSGATPRYP